MGCEQTRNSFPQQEKRGVLPLVLRTDEGTSQLECGTKLLEYACVVAEQCAGIQAADSVLGQNLGGASRTIRAHQFTLDLVPQQEMPIVAAEAVQVATFPSAFACFTKCYFAQPSQFLQQLWDLFCPRQINCEIAV